MVSKVGGVDDAAALVGEHEAAGPIEGAHPLHLLHLAGEVLLQSRHGYGRELHAASALRRLRLTPGPPCPAPA